jgi:hypothetical protein
MSGLNFIVWVYVTLDIHVMEILYSVSFEKCFVSEEHVVTEEGIIKVLSKESLEKFVAWAKIKRT